MENYKPFARFNEYDPALLLMFLQPELPQTIALVLTYLEPVKAAIILKGLSLDVQAKVCKKMSCMKSVETLFINKIESVFEKKLSAGSNYVCSTGIQNLIEVLEHIDWSIEKQIVEAIEDDDPELAEKIRSKIKEK